MAAYHEFRVALVQDEEAHHATLDSIRNHHSAIQTKIVGKHHKSKGRQIDEYMEYVVTRNGGRLNRLYREHSACTTNSLGKCRSSNVPGTASCTTESQKW